MGPETEKQTEGDRNGVRTGQGISYQGSEKAERDDACDGELSCLSPFTPFVLGYGVAHI